MGERSGWRARSGTGRRFTSPSRWPPRTSRHCSDGMRDPAAAGGPASITVLVADDNDVAQRLCRRVLEKAGYNVLIAPDGLQAVEVALSQRPNMILMDVAMPGIDGIEAMRRIKAEIPDQPIVIASAHSMASDRERFLAAGADDILSKPFRLADLVAIVAKLTAPPSS
ncbi:MAG: response regulator [Chloroflexi bacterium]|nr:MAG: response regulator [Chloroflexota bacterium]